MPPVSRGRPPGTRDKPFREELRRALYANDKRELMAIVKKVITAAKGGDMTAAQIIFDRIDGKVPQAVVTDDDRDLPMVLVVRWGNEARPLEDNNNELPLLELKANGTAVRQD
jgi:Family of unknown function (DUF5681)